MRFSYFRCASTVYVDGFGPGDQRNTQRTALIMAIIVKQNLIMCCNEILFCAICGIQNAGVHGRTEKQMCEERGRRLERNMERVS